MNLDCMHHYLKTILLSSIVMSCQSFAQEDNKYGEFYLKDEVKGFISFHGELRGLTDNAIDDINKTAFQTRFGYTSVDGDGDTSFVRDTDLLHYNQFGDRILGLGVEVGAQYHQLLTWFDFYFNPTQESKVPSSVNDNYHYPVKWFQYGFDWMWGYMLAPEASPVNLIPSVGFGFSSLNMQFASQYSLSYNNASDKRMESYSMGRRYYSTFGKDVVSQMELRLNLGSGISLGGFGGFRFTWYDHFSIESGDTQNYFLNYDELVGHAWFVGGKITYTMSSRAEDKARERL